MKINKSILKLICLSAIIILLTLIVNKVTADNYRKLYIKNINEKVESLKDSSYFFIGSSRVQKSINAQEVNKVFKNRNIVNLGITASTFISNCLLAESIMKKNSGVFFIELSPTIFKLSEGLVLFSKEMEIDLLKGANQLFHKEKTYSRYVHMLKIYGSYLFIKYSYQRKIRSLFRTNEMILVGFDPNDKTQKTHSISSFLTYNELVDAKNKQVKLDSYKNYINYLTDLSVQHKSKIVFFLPLTYKSVGERNIVIPLYQSLPDSLKVVYSEKFLNEITNTDYLNDINHLNTKGAKVYSQWLGEYLNANYSD